MKKTAIIQARMGSSRLPGKILKQVDGKPLLAYQVERVRQAAAIDDIVIATTTHFADDEVVDFCKKHDLSYYRGDEDDVLSRYYEAASEYKADVVIRLTSDCPVIDPKVIDRTVGVFIHHDYDYVSNTLQRTYPRGMDTEVVSFSTLQKAYNAAVKPFEREHVTPYIYRNPLQFHLKNVAYSKDVGFHRWTVDTIEDFLLIKNIIQSLYPDNPDFTLEDILALLEKHRDWVEINAHIEQKKLGE
nr:glycosyltransferase family protein [Evansella caseinilytica]